VTDRLQLLVIDDDEVDRMTVRRLLSRGPAAIDVVECDSGEAALERLRATAYDCVLLDIRLPGQSGLDVLRALRATNIRTPVIMLTGFGDEDTAVQCMKAGASDYLVKGHLGEHNLLSSVRQALRVHEAEQAAQRAGEKLHQHAEQLRLLAVAAGDLHVAGSPAELRARLARAAREIIGAEVGVAGTLDERGARGCDVAIADAEGVASTRLEEPPSGIGATCLTAQQTARDPEALRRAERLGLPIAARGWLLMPLWDEARQVTGFVHVSGKHDGEFDARDQSLLSQLAQLATSARDNAKLLRQAKAETQLREDMIAVVSHDLRNPLNVITLASRGLLSGPNPAEGPMRQKVDRIQRAAEHMRSLIDDLLDLSRIKSGQLELELRPCAPAVVVDDALETLRPLAQEKKIQIEVDVSASERRIVCDHRRLRQVFANLVGNAVKFTPAGGHIRVSARDEGGRVSFAVADDGPGIPAEHQAHIFDRYWQAPETARLGAGLGLFIAKAIVDAHGGSIDLRSTVGAGTTFTFAIPATADDGGPAA